MRRSHQSVLPDLFRDGRTFRLILIDGSHEYDNVRADLINAWKLLSVGGVLIVDDYIGFPEVQQACDEFAPGRFVRVNPSRSKMAMVDKRREYVA